MSNQEILYCLYIEKGLPTKVVSLKDLERFVINEKSNLKSKGNNISTSALNYAVLKFILEYCVPPYEKISSSDKWELYHVEMVFFQLGSERLTSLQIKTRKRHLIDDSFNMIKLT